MLTQDWSSKLNLLKYVINKHLWFNTVLRFLAFKNHFLLCFSAESSPRPPCFLTRYSHFSLLNNGKPFQPWVILELDSVNTYVASLSKPAHHLSDTYNKSEIPKYPKKSQQCAEESSEVKGGAASFCLCRLHFISQCVMTGDKTDL